MGQLHRRFTDEQIRMLMQSYGQGQISRHDVQELLGVGRARFFVHIKDYHQDPQGFSSAYRRTTPGRLAADGQARGGWAHPWSRQPCQTQVLAVWRSP